MWKISKKGGYKISLWYDLFVSISIVIAGIRQAQPLYFVLIYFTSFTLIRIATSNRL